MHTVNHPWVYFFGAGQADAGGELRHIVGGKGASLGDMTRANLNVPPGFTISAECCDLYHRNDRRWPDRLEDEIRRNLARLETLTGRTFGRGDDPLLVAVRSGAAQSMPGMMDTILNVGMNPESVRLMGQRTNNPAGAWQGYVHFQKMFARTTTNLTEAELDRLVDDAVRSAGKSHEDDLAAPLMESLSDRIAEAHRSAAGDAFPTDPWRMLAAAINAVFDSWMNDRATTYRRSHKIAGLLGTAVTIQAMCPAEISGVLFTCNPVDPASDQMIIEASYGLGEAIVLGKVTPDRFILDKRTGELIERHIARKEKRVAVLSADGRASVGAADDASLSEEQVEELGRLGRRVEEYYRHPCDIEWALSGGQFVLLQSRAIKVSAAAVDPAEKQRLQQAEIDRLKTLSEPRGTVWARFNLSEILPEPTPMTWSIVRPFMSVRGGYGLMYRDLGFDPDPELGDESPFDLIAGRVFCNLSREPRLQYGNLPFEHDFQKLKADPARAIYPTAAFNPRQATLGFWFRFPVYAIRQWWGESKRLGELRTFADRYERTIAPEFIAATSRAAEENWDHLTNADLLDRLQTWRRMTLVDFTRESLKPTALAALLMAKIEGAFARRFQPPGTRLAPDQPSGLERARSAMQRLTMGVRPPSGADVALGIEKLAAGTLDRDQFLRDFGHRGSHEMELARPRWAESPHEIDALREGGLHEGHVAASTFDAEFQQVARDLRLAPFQLPFVEREIRSLHRLLGLREAAKHDMLRGYALIRRVLVILGERYDLGDGIFFLTVEELPDLTRRPTGDPSLTEFRAIIDRRRKERECLLSLAVPQVLFSDDLEAIDRVVSLPASAEFRGTPISAGQGEAIAWVIEDVDDAAPPAENYILVCPSTDPSWVPLFGKARGLVMETGGVLSHGAIVAREFGLPAVAGIPDVHRRLRTGQRLFVDGAAGVVKIVSEM